MTIFEEDLVKGVEFNKQPHVIDIYARLLKFNVSKLKVQLHCMQTCTC